MASTSRLPKYSKSRSTGETNGNGMKHSKSVRHVNSDINSNLKNGSNKSIENKNTKMHKKKVIKVENDSVMLHDILLSMQTSVSNQIIKNEYKKELNYLDKKELKKECATSRIINLPKQCKWEFKEYAGKAFDIIRKKVMNLTPIQYINLMFGNDNLNDTKYVNNLDMNNACNNFWERMSTNSKSGQIFYQTKNGKWILKSMPKTECHYFRDHFLYHYFNHLLHNTDTLLTKIIGVYCIDIKKHKKQEDNYKIHFLIMTSVLFCEIKPRVKMHKIYDLKGSKHNRTATRHKLELNEQEFNELKEIANKYDEIETLDDEKSQINNKNIWDMQRTYSPSIYQDNSANIIKPAATMITVKNKQSTNNQTTIIGDPNAKKKQKNGKKLKKARSFGNIFRKNSTNNNNNSNYNDNDSDSSTPDIEMPLTDTENDDVIEFEPPKKVDVYKRSKFLKDNDFIQDEQKIKIGTKLREKYLKQLRKDLDFLIKTNVMDYSLLVGFHYRDKDKYKNMIPPPPPPDALQNNGLPSFGQSRSDNPRHLSMVERNFNHNNNNDYDNDYSNNNNNILAKPKPIKQESHTTEFKDNTFTFTTTTTTHTFKGRQKGATTFKFMSPDGHEYTSTTKQFVEPKKKKRKPKIHTKSMQIVRKLPPTKKLPALKPKRIKDGNLFTFEFGGMCSVDDFTKNIKDNKSLTTIYFTGLIDFLQEYNTKKKMESVYKSVKYAKKGGKKVISSVHPKDYADRLYNFIEKYIV